MLKMEIEKELKALDTIRQVAESRHVVSIISELNEIVSALAANRFNVAVVGQFKRGKSTLINALIGRELLPSDIAPKTSAVTVLQYGDREKCRIIYNDGRDETIPLDSLGLYASEDGNPGNHKGIRIIVIELPIALLESGMRLVDTPGIGSVFEPNSETTRAFLPRIDVAAVVLGSDPPITGDELELVKSLSQRVERLCFIINKSDIVSQPDRQRAETFTRKVLSTALDPDSIEIIHTSALTALQGKTESGVDRLIQILTDMAANHGRNLARQSAFRAATFLAERLLQQINLEKEGLIEPLACLDENIGRFNLSMKDIDDLMLAAKVRIEKTGFYDWKDWSKKKDEYAAEQSQAILSIVKGGLLEKKINKQNIRKMALSIARYEAKNSVEKWIFISTKRFNEFYDDRLKASNDELNNLTARISAAATEAFGTPITHLELQKLKIDLASIPLEFIEPALALDLRDLLVPIIDIIMPRKIIIDFTLKRIKELVDDWLMKNLYQVDERLINWLDNATRSLMASMSARLEDLKQEILGAVAEGRNRRDNGQAAISHRLSELEEQRAKLDEILRQPR